MCEYKKWNQTSKENQKSVLMHLYVIRLVLPITVFINLRKWESVALIHLMNKKIISDDQ